MQGYEWYKTGLVAVRHGDNQVIGTDTDWLKNGIKKGDIFILDSQIYEISEVIGNTSLSLTENYTGESAGGKAYSIITRAGEVFQAEIALKLQQTVAYWNAQEKEYADKFHQLDERTKFLDGLGFYQDEDGNLAQDHARASHSSSESHAVLTSLPVASREQLGGVKIGKNVDVTEDGTISVDVDKELIQESLKKAAASSEDVKAVLDEAYSDQRS